MVNGGRGGPGRGRRGGIRRRPTVAGRPCTTGIGAGLPMGRGRGCSVGCSAAATLARRRGWWRWTPPWCAPITLRRGRVANRRATCRRRCWPSRWPTLCRPTPRQRRRARRGRRASGGAGSNDTNSQPGRGKPGDREALGRSRGGLSTRSTCSPIPLPAAEHRDPAGQRHDSLAFDLVLDRLRVQRPGRGRPRRRPDAVLADKAYSSKAIRSGLRARGIRATIPLKTDQQAGRRGRKAGPTARLRPGGLPRPQRRRTRHRQAPRHPSGRHPLRQTRLRLPRYHHPRRPRSRVWRHATPHHRRTGHDLSLITRSPSVRDRSSSTVRPTAFPAVGALRRKSTKKS